MAQAERSRSYLVYPQREQLIPNKNLRSQKGSNLHMIVLRSSLRESSPNGHWSVPTTPTLVNLYNHEDDFNHHQQQAKKSIMARVKEKAKKWRQMFVKKRHGDKENSVTPPWGVSLDEADEEDPDYHGSPKYEPEMALDSYEDSASDNQSTIHFPSPSEKSTIPQLSTFDREIGMKQANDGHRQPQSDHGGDVKVVPAPPETTVITPTADKTMVKDKYLPQPPVGDGGDNDKTLSETVSETLAPAYAMISEATQALSSKIQESGPRYETTARQVWDKGVSMKEYLMQKLEPREEDKALCEVITDAVSPRNVRHSFADVGIASNRKEPVSSLMAKKEPIPLTDPHSGRQIAAVRTHTTY
ncbi:hypothetical protein MUK42_05175 [Musa troglodytarum]|uniref:LTI65/LTI78 PGEED repeat domain-containing protein n=1 Tax=Musa troglodytarum TaxID=320322 RepID=A0A9E7EUC5_9LILI|nr:hypothetical protein MUK42_05175 [Musa troglodytarum]